MPRLNCFKAPVISYIANYYPEISIGEIFFINIVLQIVELYGACSPT